MGELILVSQALVVPFAWVHFLLSLLLTALSYLIVRFLLVFYLTNHLEFFFSKNQEIHG
jgi:hypothetical protein